MTARRRPSGGRIARALPVVVDASVAVQWFANEAGSETAARLIEGEEALAAPDIMPVEAANDPPRYAGWKSSTTLPDGSSQRICWPPGPLTISFRKVTPCRPSSPMKVARSPT